MEFDSQERVPEHGSSLLSSMRQIIPHFRKEINRVATIDRQSATMIKADFYHSFQTEQNYEILIVFFMAIFVNKFP
jgi:hypothetical protein